MDNERLDRLLKFHDEQVASLSHAHTREKINIRGDESDDKKGLVISLPARASDTAATSRQILDMMGAAGIEAAILSASSPRPRWAVGVRLGCNYKGELRTVNSEVCRWHQEELDPFCLNECDNLWVAKHLKGGKR